MTEKEKKYLSDILIAISTIDEFLVNTNSFSLYANDKKTKSAVERQLAILGEAVNRFLKSDPGNTLNNSKKMIDFRNRLIHAYDSIDDNIVWVIVQKHLIALKEEIEIKLATS